MYYAEKHTNKKLKQLLRDVNLYVQNGKRPLLLKQVFGIASL